MTYKGYTILGEFMLESVIATIDDNGNITNELNTTQLELDTPTYYGLVEGELDEQYNAVWFNSLDELKKYVDEELVK